MNADDVRAAQERIDGYVLRTPLVPAVCCGAQLKLECLQPTGSFKVRGATNKILGLLDEQRSRGVVTLSTGNHGRAVAHVARQLGIRAVVCMSTRVPPNKVRAIEALGAELRVEGDSQDEAGVIAMRLADEEGLTLVPPFDDADVIAGQGTIALEILEERPTVDTIVVPLSGGGLVSGIAVGAAGRARVVAVSAERTPVMLESVRAGTPVTMPETDTVADSLLGGIGENNQHTFAIVREHVAAHVVVTEAQITAAMVAALQDDGLLLEGAGAAGIAAVRAGAVEGSDIVVVASGRNVDPRVLLRAMEDEDASPGHRRDDAA